METQDNKISTDKLFLMMQNSQNFAQDWDRLCDKMDAPPFHEYLRALLDERKIDTARLSVKSLLSRSFTYQICSGERMPGRDIVLRLAIVLELSMEETQRLLKLANRGILYPKVKRDCVFIYSITNKYDLYRTDELLIQTEQEPLL